MESNLKCVFADDGELGFIINWFCELGFGEIRISKDVAPQKIIIDSECMSKEFVKRVLCALVDDAIID